ncbi:PIF-7 [Parapoynx stagnalis nucleopolyhedrovirus]|uniref:PIF-7 n=1 Tax=Parapoynx stagnalis nucleopolyhedrovirus TaxID=2993413 RepID=A0A9E7Y6S4_9ABAC|nr:PIF-7 [Parapoynx stagnalis nucleopolyhedrovirus]
MYFVSATFLIIIFIYLMYFIVIVIINNTRVRRELFYKYNYIPDTLLDAVTVYQLK